MRILTIDLRGVLIAALMTIFVPLSPARAQAARHLVSVKMVGKAGGQFTFEPATFAVQRGDTVRFIQASSAPHNVHFTTIPKGAKLGKALSGPYLMAMNATYDVAIDKRFVDGTYGIICDPHESVGMRATMTVGAATR